MRKSPVILLVAVAVLASGQGRANAARVLPEPAWAGTCGLPRSTPLWVEYGWPDFSEIFGRPGIVVGGSGGDFGVQMRQAGAATVFFDLYLNRRTGTPSAPAGAAAIQDRANKLFDYAAQQMGCSTPVVVENELFGAGLVTPWSETNAAYRQNVLALLQALAARGAHPVLLINSDPYTGGDAGAWWRQVATVSDIVREAYIPATAIWKQGPVVGSRTLRIAYRRSIEELTSIGIPPQRLGIMVSFSTTKGFGGRNGLQPAQAWFEVGKWQALAAKSVASELAIGSVWSWGWAEWTDAEKDPDKVAAACVWLWARDSSLCDGPGQAGPGFDLSRVEGQVQLAPGVQCTFAGRALSNGAIQRLQLMTGDRDTAFTALFQRMVENRLAPVSPANVLAAERSVVATQFQGSRSGYLSALAQAHANLATARGILGDELRRITLEAKLPAGTPAGTEISTFYQSYPDLLVRRVQMKKPSPWLGGRTRGLLLSAIAPQALFKGGARTVWTPTGSVAVTPLGAALPLGAVPLDQARPSIVAALEGFARGEAYERWSEGVQQRALNTAICAHDDLPQPGAVELSTYLPFLRLN